MYSHVADGACELAGLRSGMMASSILHAGTFPFGDPDDANGKNGVQTMIARIMKVDITPLPEALSPELKELLQCILVADPTKRPNIQQVKATKGQEAWVILR